jgi:hypothetical protein
MAAESNNFRISEAEKRFREYLKQFHPEKYNRLIAVEKKESEDNVLIPQPT